MRFPCISCRAVLNVIDRRLTWGDVRVVFVVVQQFRAMFVHFRWETIDVCRSSVEFATLSCDFHAFLVCSYCFRVFIAEHRGFAFVICRDCEMLVVLVLPVQLMRYSDQVQFTCLIFTQHI